MERLDVWLSDKKTQGVEKATGKGSVFEFYGSCQTETYDAWEANGRNGQAPARYLFVTLSVWTPELAAHLTQIAARAKHDDPRPHAHVTGQWGKTREWEGKTFADFTARDASPLIWAALPKKKAE